LIRRGAEREVEESVTVRFHHEKLLLSENNLLKKRLVVIDSKTIQKLREKIKTDNIIL
jgi:hypothetical protein